MASGGIFGFVGVVLVGVAGYHLVTGVPLIQANSRSGGGEHIATPAELGIGIAGGVVMMLFSLLMTLVTVNCAITIDEEGLFATNFLKLKVFRAKWSEVTDLARINPRPGSGYKLSGNGKALDIHTTTNGMKELIAEIEHRAPALTKD